MNFKTKQQAFIEGFSSDDEYTNETIQNYWSNDNQAREIDVHQQQTKSVLNKISPPGQIKQKNYSLQPDLLTGWNPRIYLPKPIPLTFCNDQLDFDIEMIIKTLKPDQPLELCYLGPRYQSTYSAWYDKPFPFPYSHLNSTKRLKFTDRQFCGQYWNSQTKDHLMFDSFFESANLDSVFKVGQTQYDLFMRVDSNTRGHLQWYNFKVKNMIKDVKYKFNICNFQKGKSLYARGMKPFIYSRQRFLRTKIGWLQVGENVQYQKKTPKTFRITQTDIDFKPLRLTFQYTNIYDLDEVQIAYCIPYQYTKLLNFIEKIQQKCANKQILKVSKLCHSLGGFNVPLLTVTNQIDEMIEDNTQFKNRKIVFISARVHPGQSNSSYMMEGFINFICSDSVQSQMLRESVIFKIVPMINPDGVIIGNYRTSLSGKDLNRQFINPDKNIFPEVAALKQTIWKYKRVYQNNFLMFLDFHGHSVKKNVFTYGPQFPITNNNYYECRIFPKLISMKTPMFRFFSCSFKVSECKQSTARAVLFKNFGINLVYTVQASNGCYYNIEKLEDIMFDEEKLRQVGQSIGRAINDYIKIQNQIALLKQKKRQERMKIKKIKQKQRIKQTGKNRLIVKGYQTAYSPFRKQINDKIELTKQNEKQQKVTFKDSVLPFLKNQQFGELFKQICGITSEGKQQDKNSQEIQQLQKKSDDNISQGGSDSSGSSQDLDTQQRSNLYLNIKKGNEKLVKKYIKPKATNVLQKFAKSSKHLQNNNQKFLTQIDVDEDQQEQSQLQMKRMGTDATFKISEFKNKRNIYLKRKINNINFTPSPKKEDNRAYTAKIVNFHFALQPTIPYQPTPSYSNNISDQGVSPQIRKPLIASEYVTTQTPQIKRYSRLNDYSDTFKKTFLSVQKQLSQKNIANRRKSQKKNFVHSFYQICAPKKLENIRGKRIQTQQGSTTPQIE